MNSKIIRLSSMIALNLVSDKANGLQMESDLKYIPSSLAQLSDGPDLDEDNDGRRDLAAPSKDEILKNKLMNFLQVNSESDPTLQLG